MLQRTKIFFFLLLMAYILQQPVLQAQPVSEYQKEIDAWHNKRIRDLKAPDGWVNLAGLFWLQPGKNRFGSDAKNELVFNHPDMPGLAGYFDWGKNGDVQWMSANGVSVTIQDSSIHDALVYQNGQPGGPLLSMGHFRWNIIKRNDKTGIRFRDLENQLLAKFADIERFPVDSIWRIPAHLEFSQQPTIAIANVLGQISAQETPGKLVFSIQGIDYRLDALEETPGELFIIFGDATSGKETYPAGRFLYMPKPKLGEISYIDFNKAFNPPCAFSLFATCPLPPKQNILPVAITAGEKNYDNQ